VCDGKYFNVVNGANNQDWVLLWGVDYFRHDIPVILVAPSESYTSWSKFREKSINSSGRSENGS
jgi:hypothetical protein